MTAVSYTDEVLIAQIKGGDDSAFSKIYERYWEELFIIAAKVLRSKEEAADVVQDVFLSLWNRKNEITITSSLAAYLKTSVRYKAIHYIEKNVTRRDYLALLTDTAVHLVTNPEMQLHLKQMQAIINETVENMPAKMKEVYTLSRKEHLNHRQIAEQLGISTETVKKHVQHALQLIKTALGNSSLSVGILLYYLLQQKFF